jgi:hypothetical protein
MKENNKLKKTVFISYSRKDIDLVQSFLDVGDNRFFKTKIDQADKKVGADWRVTIRDMINSSDGAILFISKNALDPKSPINTEEIPLLIKRNNDPEDKFEFFPVFLDYVDESTVNSYTFKEFGTGKEIHLFDKYDIWNIEANDPNDIGQEMPSEMSENKLENFWSDLNLKLSDALKGKTVNKLGEIKTWNSNKAKLREVRKNKFRNFALGTLIIAAFISLFYLVLRPDESLQTSEVFNIGGSVQLGVLTTGDCFNKIDNESELNWNTYVQYRACDLLHDGEVFYRENQLDFGDNIVSYSNLLNFFNETCNNEFQKFTNSSTLPQDYTINFYWDMDTQALGSKPFDMLCLTTSNPQTAGSYVEDVTGVGIVLPNPGDKYNCEDFTSNQDAQTWYELYFEDYGDVAYLDLNNNGIVCDEINLETAETTTTTLTPTTSTTIDTISPSGQTPVVVQETLDVNFDLLKELQSENSKSIASSYTQDKSAQEWLDDFTIKKQYHWKNAIQLQWSGCYFMGCSYKVYINGVNIGSHEYEGEYYHPNNVMVLKGLLEDTNYNLEIYVVDAIGQMYGPARYSFNGMDWDNDNTFATDDTNCANIERYTIYCYQDQIKFPTALAAPEIEILNRGNDYLFRLNNWEIASRRGWVGYTHILLFVEGKLRLMLGNGIPQQHGISKDIVGKEITLVAFDSFARPGASYTFKFTD